MIIFNYKWDWGNRINSGWFGLFYSEETCEASHIWDKGIRYNIKVNAKDTHGLESEWSDPLSLSIPKTRIVSKV